MPDSPIHQSLVTSSRNPHPPPHLPIPYGLDNPIHQSLGAPPTALSTNRSQPYAPQYFPLGHITGSWVPLSASLVTCCFWCFSLWWQTEKSLFQREEKSKRASKPMVYLFYMYTTKCHCACSSKLSLKKAGNFINSVEFNVWVFSSFLVHLTNDMYVTQKNHYPIWFCHYPIWLQHIFHMLYHNMLAIVPVVLYFVVCLLLLFSFLYFNSILIFEFKIIFHY